MVTLTFLSCPLCSSHSRTATVNISRGAPPCRCPEEFENFFREFVRFELISQVSKLVPLVEKLRKALGIHRRQIQVPEKGVPPLPDICHLLCITGNLFNLSEEAFLDRRHVAVNRFQRLALRRA